MIGFFSYYYYKQCDGCDECDAKYKKCILQTNIDYDNISPLDDKTEYHENQTSYPDVIIQTNTRNSIIIEDENNGESQKIAKLESSSHPLHCL